MIAAVPTISVRDLASIYERRLCSDPVRWAQTMLDVHLWSRQREILRSVFQRRRTIVPSGHGVGKTFVSAVAVLAFLFTRKPSKVITTAPTWRQVRDVLWSEITGLARRHLVRRWGWKGDVLQTVVRVHEDWFAVGISSDDPTNFQGYHQRHVLVVIDEAPGIENVALWQAIDSLTSTGDAHVLAIGNPTSAEGPFYDACRSPEWHRISISCYDSPNFTGEDVPDEVRERLVTPEWVEEKRREWGEESPVFISRVLGQFPPEGVDTIIPLSWAERAIRREHPETADHPRCAGLDVARMGGDKTVLVGLFGETARVLYHAANRDLMDTVGRALDLCRAHDIEVIAIDDSGLGGGVTDRLREVAPSSLRIVPINVGEAARDAEHFANLRAELWWRLRDWIAEVGAIPPDDYLVADLTAPKYRYTSRGQIALEPKEETRKRLGRSPDYADALMLAVAARDYVRRRETIGVEVI